MNTLSGFFSSLAAGALLLSAVPAQAQLPSVQQVYDRYAEAVGGREAWSSINGRTETGTVDLSYAGVSGPLTRYFAAPNKIFFKMDLGVIVIQQGFDGEKGWIMEGDAITRLPPAEEQKLAVADFKGAAFLDPTRYNSAAVLGKEVFDGVECYKVAFSARSGSQGLEYFDTATGLRRGQNAEGQSVFLREYGEFDGKKVPTRIVQQTPAGDMVMSILSVSFETPDESNFKAPAGIRE